MNRPAFTLRRPSAFSSQCLTFAVTQAISLLTLLVLLAGGSVFGQSNYASLSGVVFDPQRQVVPGAFVQLTSLSTHAVRQVNSNDSGAFQVPGLLPGEYKLSVEARGFASLTETVRLEVGQQMTIDLNLNLSSLSGNVNVEAETINVLRTTDASTGEVVEPTSVRSLPLNGRMLID